MLSENKLLSIISILGTALAICMIMVMVILYVVKTAGFKPETNRDRTYYTSVVMTLGKDDGRRISFGSIGLPLIRECIYPLQTAERVTALSRSNWDKLSATTMDGLSSYSGYVSFTDTAFWEVFDFDFVEGAPFTPADFRSGISAIVINESTAHSLFGSEQAVGKDMKLNFVVYRVAGVVKDVSRFASTAYADMWVPYTSVDGYDQASSEGISGGYMCCALLKPGHTQEEMQAEVSNRLATFNSGLKDVKAKLPYQPRSQVEEWLGGGSDYASDLFGLYLRYGLIFFILLLVPALNLSGITLTRMKKRVGELGIRRAFGATKSNIIGLVLLENMVLTLVGGLVGLAFSYGAMLVFKDWLLVTSMGEEGLTVGMFRSDVFLIAFCFCLVMNLMSAGLPAWRVSRVNITDSING